MNKNIVLGLALTALLTACGGSKAVKDEPPPAKVEEKSPQTASVPKAQPATDDSSAKTAPLKPKETVAVNPLKDPNNILSKRSIYFDFDKYEVKPEFRALIEAHAKYLNSHPDAKVMLQGNTDDRGSREYNLALGQRRSTAVKQVMNLLNVNDKQIETVSYGEEKPRCAEQNEACWAQNRRADIYYEGE